MTEPSTAAPAASLPAALRLGAVELVVRDLERSTDWYERVLGLQAGRSAPGVAELGTGGAPVVVLNEDPEARTAGRHAGLYHYALLFADRRELARALMRVAQARTPVQGFSDHGTHEAIYLPDPDGIGIELAADRPRERWPSRQEIYGAGPQPLAVDDLLATVAGQPPSARAAEGLRVGHVHLHVGDVEQGLRFYRDVLGFEEQARIGTSAAFVSAGGYHHHLAFNVWRGAGVGHAPEHVAGLRHWTIELPSADDVERVRARVRAADVADEPFPGGFLVRDPWRIAVAIVAAG